MYREYGYSLRGVPISGKVSGRKFKRTNVVAAKCGDRVIAPMIYDGITDSVIFEYWFEALLLKSIPRFSVIILDNAAFHRKARLREMARIADCEVLFLPPYSPDLNPIEMFWAWLKRKLRNILCDYSCLDNALMDCF